MNDEDDPRKAPDLAALRSAVEGMLRASGLDPRDEDLAGTPERVATSWHAAFLSGYQMDPATILGDPVRGEGQNELVIARGLPFHGMCPHHLMPYLGTATLVYLPSDRLVGFGRLAELVRCFAQRLTLQERICNEVADALMEHLGARGAGCVMRGEHACMRIPDDKHDATVVTSSWRGVLTERWALHDRMMP